MHIGCTCADVAVVVVATEEGALGRAAQHVVVVEFEPLGVLGDGRLHEVRHRDVADRARGLGRGEYRAPVDDDHLLVDGDHGGGRVDPVEGEA
ncbi:MAG TPA: hypothetical protein VHT26_20850, partial [Trebonia sp.]|nr:hypothetical protein [Trebonia sp.]